jgi:hypothetical protein
LEKTSKVVNLRWSVIAAAAAFAVSLVLGISVRAQILIILIRALGFGVLFFFLAILIWRLINKYIPELLQAPSQDLSLMPNLESGSRVNITLGDESIPRDAALPPEEAEDNSLGNITEMVNRPAPAGSPLESPAEISMEGPADFPLSPSPESPAAGAESPGMAFSAAGRGMDQGSQSGYTQSGGNASRASSPSIQDGVGGFSGLGDTSGGLESLPDLDALAGSFLSPSAAGEDEPASALGLPPRSAGGARSKKGKNMGEDFNPKELASAIQTILKRD